MTKERVALLLVGLFIGLWYTTPAASAIKVAPLSYDVVIQDGQKKKGFVDITNTESTRTKYSFTVEAFRQLNSQGDLKFYSDEMLRAGILLDYESFELSPGETLHLAFIIDGAKLPSGDSFAAIFAAAAPTASGGSTAVRAGTLLTIKNGTENAREARITSLAVPFWQIGESINGVYGIKNTSDPLKSAGFMPRVEVIVNPLAASKTVQSSLVFAGIERQNNFTIPTNRFGFYKVTVAFGESKKESWVFFATPLGLLIFTACIGLIAVLAVAIKKADLSLRQNRLRVAKRHTPNRG